MALHQSDLSSDQASDIDRPAPVGKRNRKRQIGSVRIIITTAVIFAEIPPRTDGLTRYNIMTPFINEFNHLTDKHAVNKSLTGFIGYS